MQMSIAEYLENPVVTLGSVNRHSRNTLTVEYSLKYFVNQRFEIPELAKVYENEPELQHILTLSSFASYPFYIFLALVEDVINEKKRYNTLYCPLVSYLARKYENLSEIQQEIYFEHKSLSFEFHLAPYYQAKGDYKSCFEVIKDKPQEIRKWFHKEFSNSKIYEMFKLNPQLVDFIKSSFNGNNMIGFLNFIPEELFKAIWTFHCVLYNSPEYFYIDFLSQDPNLMSMVLLNSSDVFHIKTTETEEYPRIY